MTFDLTKTAIEAVDTDAAVLILFEDGKDNPPGGRFAQLAAGLIPELYERKEFTGKFLSTALIHRPVGFRAGRLLLVGGGKVAEFTLPRLRIRRSTFYAPAFKLPRFRLRAAATLLSFTSAPRASRPEW